MNLRHFLLLGSLACSPLASAQSVITWTTATDISVNDTDVVNDGRLRVFGAEDGQVLWEAETGQTGMGPPITYSLDGKQHISFMGGTGQRGGAGFRPMVYTFVLDGKTPMPTTSGQ